MEKAKGATLRESHRATYDVLRPIIHILHASGVGGDTVRSVTDRVCRLYARNPQRGTWREPVHFTELADLIRVWTRDPDFVDGTGLPKRLRLEDGVDSVRSLLRRAKCQATSRLVVEQLLAAGAVRLCDHGGRVRLLSNVVYPVAGGRFVAGPMLHSIRRLAETVEHNLCAGARPSEVRMHRWAVCTSLDSAQYEEIERYARANAQMLLDAMDEKLNARPKRGATANRSARQKRDARRRTLTCGVGLYMFVEAPERRRYRQPKRQAR